MSTPAPSGSRPKGQDGPPDKDAVGVVIPTQSWLNSSGSEVSNSRIAWRIVGLRR
eukprot:CAMPEP_0194327064 /NCGR_PEP_ID=MMETSP0171-20130528/39492_1 /TAXON_ID=218684 /ORGANISM="Corethron pennatum, Strain L29A3" /LENGTH=54 /DNA_ID=CAMNT_0039086867 /DNA_START=684 /DNA_END=848 /DNA_ORIENTATION=-